MLTTSLNIISFTAILENNINFKDSNENIYTEN